MGTVTDLLTEISTEGGFEITTSTALTVLDRRHKQMCARARWHRMTRSVVVATVTDSTYSTLEAPADAVEIFSIGGTVDDQTVAYARTVTADRGSILAGNLWTSHGSGVFIEAAETDAGDTTPETLLWLYPALAHASEVSITGAFLPPALTEAETSGAFVRVPSDLYEALLAGVYATLLNRPGESRPDLASVQEGIFSAGCGELRDRADRRYRTHGPRQIRVGGRDI